LLLYPEYNEYEMVQEWSEGVTFSEMLEQMYPAPWDKKNIYAMETILVVYRSNLDKQHKYEQKWIKVPLNYTMAEIVSRDDHFIPKLPTFHILSLKSQFTKSFLAE